MNAPIGLISTHEAFAIAEDRGWSVNEIHLNLTRLASEGRLRAWGYKGNTAQLRLIDLFTWQDHGLDMLNGQLVIPYKVFAPDYAEQIWQEVHWERHEIEAAFPPYMLVQKDSDSASTNPSGNGEDECRKWLVQLMQQSPKQHPKPFYEAEARQNFNIGSRAFIRAWEAALKETGNRDWNLSGRRRKKS
jgi:hypothetical protein